MADAMEMMILSILAPQLHCEWRLPNWEVALLTSVTCVLFYTYFLLVIFLSSSSALISLCLFFGLFMICEPGDVSLTLSLSDVGGVYWHDAQLVIMGEHI